jgi:hypothetical protein
MDSDLLFLPVSIGEALDKLSILDIKLDNIQDERKKNVKIEYDLLYEKLIPYLNKTQKYYDMLKKTNTHIWKLMDIIRDSNISDDKYILLCKETIIANDVRFRIKNKINILVNSYIKEQKGYNISKILIDLTNYMDDMDDINFLLKPLTYFSILFDEIHVKTKLEIKLFDSFNSNLTDLTDLTDMKDYNKIIILNKKLENKDDIYIYFGITNDDIEKFI